MADVLPSPLWDFALKLYQRPHIEVQCLQLQDEHQVRVPILLFICWLDLSGKEVGSVPLAETLAATATWHEQVVAPLRAARRWVKLQAPLNASQAECRERIKEAELTAERWEIEQLAERSQSWPVGLSAPQLPRLRDYLAACDVPAPLVERTLLLLQDALQAF
ncbi:TIGR02444 family protein [Gilvimarinus polysaccharolyticus]|uniref:TIGR02444 family protein n=1 Tax=Gilvimarinus polysaccharolyticus TaxID=863921 RepID=UPI0006734498|nr:TIGR02444 family protein [Gilvimarinus polysaccharolyticus]